MPKCLLIRDMRNRDKRTRRQTRRNVLKTGSALLGVGAIGSLAGCNGGPAETATSTDASTDMTTAEPEPVEIKTLGVEGAVYIPVYFLAQEEGIWEKHNINLSLEVAGFGKYTRAFTANLSDLTSFPTISGGQNIVNGEDVVYVGSHMNLNNPTFVRADSDISSVEDIAGKRLGVPFETSTNTLTNKAMWSNILDFDMFEDPSDTVSAAPPTLWNLLVNDEEIDAMITFTGYAIRGRANPDKVKTIFDPVEVWKEDTGFPPAVTNICASRDWAMDNPQTVLNFKNAWHEAVDFFRNNIDRGITQYGRLAGLTSDAEIQVVKDQVAETRVFPDQWNPDYIDSVWQLFEYLNNTGDLDSVPDKDEHSFTNSELEGF
jgi:ABC-type nitrate/sulfonate/bicarbonate transport system substrate-binding protein